MATPEAMAKSMVDNMKAKTGKSLPEWVRLAKASGEAKHGQIVKYLKTEHALTHGYANLVASNTLKTDRSETAGDLVAAQYSGPKAGLKPLYEKLVETVTRFGKDVEIAPKKAYVSLRRNKQFGLIQPSTKSRVDVGLCLKGTPPTTRLEAAGSFNAMVSHRVRVTAVDEVNAELKKWLKAAYDASVVILVSLALSGAAIAGASGDRCRELEIPENAKPSGNSWTCKKGFYREDGACPALNVPENAKSTANSWFCKKGYRRVDDHCETVVVPDHGKLNGNSWICKKGFARSGDGCLPVAAPDNAKASGNSWSCNKGFYREADRCLALSAPDHAKETANSWFCKTGFRRSEDACVAIEPPEHAKTVGNSWICNKGYTRTGDVCEAIEAPENAKASGNDWSCKNGYYRSGERCLPLDPPDHAKVAANSWFCRSGYRRVDDGCVGLEVPENGKVAGNNWVCKDGYERSGE